MTGVEKERVLRKVRRCLPRDRRRSASNITQLATSIPQQLETRVLEYLVASNSQLYSGRGKSLVLACGCEQWSAASSEQRAHATTARSCQLLLSYSVKES